jgi:RNA polymerase sigma factor FliA
MAAERDLIKKGLPVVQAMAHRIARRLGGSVHSDDLMGMGHVALIEIARSYDPSLSSFDTYASNKVKWAMLDGVRRETHSRASAARALAVIASERFGEGREPEGDEPTTEEQDRAALREYLRGKAAAMAVGLLAGPFDPALEIETPEERFAREETVEATRAAVRGLPDRERALLERHYFGGEQFDAIARDLGISKSWASRLHDRAITLLSTALTEAA